MIERPLADNLSQMPGRSALEKFAPEKPFVIELERLDRHPGGYFRPHACLKLSPVLRTSGLLAALPPDDLKSLLFMLTFVHPNGHCVPSVQEISQAMRISRPKAHSRMRRLTEFRWNGETVALEIGRESGLDAFSPTPNVIEVAERERLCPHCGRDLADLPQDGSEAAAALERRREQVVASSRERYARPRAEVERMIAEQMGWRLPGVTEEEPQEAAPETSEAGVRQRLIGFGVSREQVDFLLAQFDTERILRQLEWLPFRRAKNRAAFLVAAIENDYEVPLGLRARASTMRSDASHQEKPAA